MPDHLADICCIADNLSWPVIKLGLAVMIYFIEKEVYERYEQTKNNTLTNQKELRMCCWDFCFLVLFDAGIVEKKQLILFAAL